MKKFTTPNKISPFYNCKRIPRKLKKKVKSFCGVHYNSLTNNQRLWYFLEIKNPEYKQYIIKMICQ